MVVGTTRLPGGQPAPFEWVQRAMDMLERDGAVTIDVETVGYRAAFIGAVLATLPGAAVLLRGQSAATGSVTPATFESGTSTRSWKLCFSDLAPAHVVVKFAFASADIR